MILKGYPRISETFISNEILLLEKRGFAIHIISMRQPREPFCHKSVQEIQAPVDYLPETIIGNLCRFLVHNILLAFKSPGAYRQAVATAFRRFLRTRKAATIKHLLQGGYVTHHILPGSGITHLHAHFAHSPTSVAMFTSILSGLPFSFTAHAKDIYTSDRRQLMEKISKAELVITCTGYNRRYLATLAPRSASKIHSVYHGIDVSLFSTNGNRSSHRDRAETAVNILTVARLTAKKGLPTVYRAIAILRDQGVAVRHTLIGDGDDKADIISLIRKLDLTGITRLLGTLPHEKVLEQYRRTDLFVLGCEQAPNGDMDGIPNVFVESMAMGIPVIATRVSAIPELVEHEKTGLLIEPGDPAAMARAIQRILADDTLRRRIVNAARQRVQMDFNNAVLIQKLAGFYGELLHAK